MQKMLAGTAWMLAATTGVSPGWAQDQATMVRPGDLANVQVIGGEPADPQDWPATFIFSFQGAGCTSTAIGERVMLTAAHCVNDGQTATVSMPARQFSVRCSHHPDYDEDFSADFALCFADEPIPVNAFERVNTGLAPIRIGATLHLLGFGCLTEGGSDASFGSLYEGDATISDRPNDTSLYIKTTGGAALCFGDSGGASYFVAANGARRTIAGVNSRGDISKNSWISAAATLPFVDWAFTWSTANGAEICGLHETAKKCAAQ